MTASTAGFHIAPYGIDGEQLGLGFWEPSKLSVTWLDVCTAYLDENGADFNSLWGGKLHDFRTKFTSTSGSAIATFSVRERVASSILLLSGQSSDVEHSVREMFVESLRRTDWVQEAVANPQPFAPIVSVTERPLMVVVVWPDPEISAQEQDVTKELGLHLAAAFFKKTLSRI